MTNGKNVPKPPPTPKPSGGIVATKSSAKPTPTPTPTPKPSGGMTKTSDKKKS